MKYVVVTGGVVSGLGKGITISSIGRILKSSGLRVTSIKIDPYLNADAGTMSPFEHGETFVLDDGGETDLDLGNYERFLDITLTVRHNINSGKVYQEVIQRERRGDYLGKTVQIVPHATDLVQQWLREVAKISVDGTGASPDVCLIEVGGTVGDIESMVFLEALRQFQFTAGKENFFLVHVSLVPVLGSVGEQKTKPTQHSVKELRALGLSPDLIVCRSSSLLTESTKGKISTFCHVPPSHIISVHDVTNIYHVPLILAAQGVHTRIREGLQLGTTRMRLEPDLSSWASLAHTVDNFKSSVDIALVGKYTGLEDAYLSVIKALNHASMHLNVEVRIRWVEASHLEEETRLDEPDKYAAAWEVLRAEATKGILIPGGFGSRGVQGMIAATRHAREHRIPLLGICLGMQVMVIEHALHVCKIERANSAEFDEATPNPVVLFMPEVNPNVMGGTMRLGARTTLIATELQKREVTKTTEPSLHISTAAPLTPTTATATTVPTTTTDAAHRSTLAAEVYGYSNYPEHEAGILERHRHRYEVNPERVEQFEASGLYFSGRDETGVRMEIAERSRDEHPFFLGVQYHPELKSRPNRPSPPLFAFAAMACGLPQQLGRAGAMWREYGEGQRSEPSWLYSPSSGLKKRPVSALSGKDGATEEEEVGMSGKYSSITASAVGTALPSPCPAVVLDAPVSCAASVASGGVASGGYKMSPLKTLRKHSI